MSSLVADQPVDFGVIASLRELEQASGQFTLVERLIDRFVFEAPKRVAGLRLAVKRDDAELLAAQAHGLSGSAGVVGATLIAALAQSLDHDPPLPIDDESRAAVDAIEAGLQPAIDVLSAMRAEKTPRAA